MNTIVELNNPFITQLGVEAKTAFFHAIADNVANCPGIVAISTHVDDPELNLVFDVQLDSDENKVKEKVVTVLEFFKNYPYSWSWIIGPLTKPSNLTNYLHNYAFEQTEQYPGMYFDLNNTLHTIEIKNFTIEKVKPADQLTEWIKPVALAFEFDNLIDAENYRLTHAKRPHGNATSFHHFIGFHENQPASAVTLFIHNNAAVIRNLTTSPQFSKRGFATALMTYVMNVAKELGCQHCFLDASEEGVSVYRKIGFKIYSLYSSYSLS